MVNNQFFINMTVNKNIPQKPKARGGKPLMSELLKDTRKYLEQAELTDVEPLRQFLFSNPERPLIAMGHGGSHSSAAFADMPINHKVFLAQFDTIKNIAKEGPCIMVGRCADYALSDFEDSISVFIHADLDKRIRRIARKFELTDSAAKDRIQKTDKRR